MDSKASGCFACQKHRGEIELPGGAIVQDELIYCGHAWSLEEPQGIYLGACIVEPKRHVASWADLSDIEAKRIGIVIRDVALALERSESAEHVYVFVLGHHVPHLHVWVVPRFAETPREYWGLQLFEWPERVRGDAKDVEEMCDRLRVELSSAK
jgi:diadenosine tetraphosphate (Ap4A) HIT family hydrolase